MQTITPLTNSDFEKASVVVISKIEIDSDGNGDFQELPDVKSCSITSNEENRVAKLCSYSFNIVCLNTDNRYGFLNSGSAYYGWLKQGRRVKLYAGIKKDGTEYFYQYLLGRIDLPKLSKSGGNEICTINGRCMMRMLLEYKLYLPDTYWGTDVSYNTVANQMTYSMEADCKGIHKVELDSTPPYDGSNLEEIFEGRDWTYDWNLNKLVFVSRKAPDFAGTNNLKVYYYQTQNVEDVVGDILLKAGILADAAARTAWLASGYCTATGETIDRVWFKTATSSSKALMLLAEVVQYRLRFDYEGNPIFRPKASIGVAVDDLEYSEMKIQDESQNIEEVYTHVIVIGETRDRILGDDETAPAVPTNLALSTGFGESTQAGLAYIKATWDANTESDFGHYELRIKKNADSDYTEVSTIATSFMFLGMEPGVTYNVQIRACDIYENRSAWSTAEDQVTATDTGTPAQTTGQTATAIVGGIKIEWTKNSENNIAYYLVERQESPDNIDWSGGWVEISRINGDMWLDLLLTYSKYYRYRITAYTVANVVGVTSAFTTAIQPSQVGTNDVAGAAITAVKIDVINLSTIKADMGHITAGDITLDNDGFIRTLGKDNYASATAGFWLGYDTDKYKLNIGDASEYLKWDGVNLSIKGSITLVNTIPYTDVSGLGDLAVEDSVAYGEITGTKPPSNADVTISAIEGSLSLTGGGLTLASGGAAIKGGQTAYATGTGFWLGDVSGVSKFSIGSSTRYLKWDGTKLDIQGNIKIGGTGSEQEICFKDSTIRGHNN